MYYYLYGIHLLVAISWMVFLLLFIYSRDKVFGFISLFFMVVVLGIGTKMMLLNPTLAKSGSWLHVKLSFDILLMIENVFLLFKRVSDRVRVFLFWFSYLSFIIMIALTMFRPF